METLVERDAQWKTQNFKTRTILKSHIPNTSNGGLLKHACADVSMYHWFKIMIYRVTLGE